MKKALLLLFFVTSIANAQIVNIPDANFKAKLIATGVDTNSDGNIQVSEALAQTSLMLYNANISDLTGINSFQNVVTVNCMYNSLTNLNIALPHLLVFLCNHNQLTSLNVSGCPLLNNFSCSYNQLTTLNFGGSNSIMQIDAEGNLLTSVNVVGCSQLINLYLSTNNLTSINLTGLTNLKELHVSYNNISALNVSSLNTLTKITCSSNMLSTLDVSGLSLLGELLANDNPILNSLNISNCTALAYVGAEYCNVMNLNTSGCTSLTQISMAHNNLNTVALNNLPNLQYLHFSSSNIQNLTITNCPKLFMASLDDNNLNTLDLSTCTSLDYLHAENNPNLTSLYIKNGLNEHLYIQNNTNLVFICADATQVASVQSQANSNAVVSSYCSFVPGGNYNSVSGVVRFDQNNNGCDGSDPAFPNSIGLTITNGTITSSVFPNTNGSYTLYAATGTQTLTPQLENPAYFNVSPPSAVFNFPLLNGTTQTQNFCLTANGVHNDLEVVVVPLIQPRPGFDSTYKIVYKNKGNQTLSGTINFTYEDAVLDLVETSIDPDVLNAGELIWNFSNLMPFQGGEFVVRLNVNSATEMPPVNIGDMLNFTATINPISGDDTPLDNASSLRQTVVGSLDPNNKACLEGNIVSPTRIGDYLHYNINFENTGTAPATFVVVRDEIDTYQFNLASLRILNSSHPMTVTALNGAVEFIFQNINLGPGQHGNVTFKIKTKSTLTTGSTVTNIADIYFDYNYPVTTNFAVTTFQALSNSIFDVDNSISVYPNPATDIINIQSNTTIKSMQLYDVQGRVLQTSLENNANAVIDISQKSNGIYFLKITSEKGSKVEKIVKE